MPELTKKTLKNLTQYDMSVLGKITHPSATSVHHLELKENDKGVEVLMYFVAGRKPEKLEILYDGTINSWGPELTHEQKYELRPVNATEIVRYLNHIEIQYP